MLVTLQSFAFGLLQGTQKKVWAYASCKVITEGEAFGACRRDIGETVVQTYFSNCVKAACT